MKWVKPIQWIERTDASIRFHTPKWMQLAAIAIVNCSTIGLFSVGFLLADQPFRFVWFSFLALFALAYNLAAVSNLQRGRDGELHLQIDLQGVIFGGIANRPIAFVAYEQITRIYVGKKYQGLLSPVVFELQDNLGPGDLDPYLSRWSSEPAQLVGSYSGVSGQEILLTLRKLCPPTILLVPFSKADSYAELCSLVASAIDTQSAGQQRAID